MFSKFNLTIYLSVIIVLLALMVLGAIVINSPYYPGFERGLNYLSSDLSEYRVVIRDKIYLKRKSRIKLVFEKKAGYSNYDRDDIEEFLKDLEVQVWNESEFFIYKKSDISSYVDNLGSSLFEIDLGEVKSNGLYFIYIKSDQGINAYYHIGVGIGREKFLFHIGNNARRFY